MIHVLILFNNLLQSLFKSQILTLGFVMMGIFIMFLIYDFLHEKIFTSLIIISYSFFDSCTITYF